jgi:hypothetical protein
MSLSIMTLSIVLHFISYYAENRHADCRYAECYYAECRCTLLNWQYNFLSNQNFKCFTFLGFSLSPKLPLQVGIAKNY